MRERRLFSLPASFAAVVAVPADHVRTPASSLSCSTPLTARLPFRGEGYGAAANEVIACVTEESSPCSIGLSADVDAGVSGCPVACCDAGEVDANRPPTKGISSADIFPSPFVSRTCNTAAAADATTVGGVALGSGTSLAVATVEAFGAEAATTAVAEAGTAAARGADEARTVVDDLLFECEAGKMPRDTAAIGAERLLLAAGTDGEGRGG